MRSMLVFASLLACLVLMSPASAHHSGAMYDEKSTVTVTGAVSRFEWSNPHVYIYVRQMTTSGDNIEWEVECSPPSILGRLGWTRETIHVGDSITVSGKPAKAQGNHRVSPDKIKVADNVLFDRKGELQRLESDDRTPVVAHDNSQLQGVWVTLLSLKVEKMLDVVDLPLTAKGKLAAKRFDEATMHPGTKCIASPAPFFMSTPDLKRITIQGDSIVIDGEFDGASRTIHMNASSFGDAPDSIQGYSIGRWEGKDLVIDTTHFAFHLMGNGYGLPSGARKHLSERLTPDASASALNYHFELTDPEYLAQPVVGDVKWVLRPDLTYAPPKCDPANARRSFPTLK